MTAASHYTTGLSVATGTIVGLAVDGAGNIFGANLDGLIGGVSEVIGLAKPVLTPVQACLKKGKNVCQP